MAPSLPPLHNGKFEMDFIPKPAIGDISIAIDQALLSPNIK